MAIVYQIYCDPDLNCGDLSRICESYNSILNSSSSCILQAAAVSAHYILGATSFSRICDSQYSAILAGCQNCIDGGTNSAIMTGQGNAITAMYGAIGSGSQNNISGDYSFIGSGQINHILSTSSAIGGGRLNNVCGDYSVIAGGHCNTVCGAHSAILGGCGNNDANYSFAGIFGQGITAVCNNFFHIENLFVKNMCGSGSGGIVPGTVYYQTGVLPGVLAACKVLMIA